MSSNNWDLKDDVDFSPDVMGLSVFFFISEGEGIFCWRRYNAAFICRFLYILGNTGAEGALSHSDSVITVTERLEEWQACMSSQMKDSCRHFSASSRKCNIKNDDVYIYTFNFSSPPAPIFYKRALHCLAPHDSSPFTAKCFILPQLSLVVWQKNWKSTDYVYFQNRAYQSVIRPLWCSLLYLQLMIHVISVLSPRMCCFPSRHSYLEYFVWVISVCGDVGGCVWSIFQGIWRTLQTTLHSLLEQS